MRVGFTAGEVLCSADLHEVCVRASGACPLGGGLPLPPPPLALCSGGQTSSVIYRVVCTRAERSCRCLL